MTYKSAAADLPLGGGKGVIMAPSDRRPERTWRRSALLDFADTVAALDGSYITAEDVGTSSRDMSLIAERTRHVAGLARRRGGSGDPSPFTALGVEAAIRACCERIFSTSALRDRSICVIGLGHVGSRVARRCARGGAKVFAADIDPAKQVVAEQLGASWIDPHSALELEVDVLAPCALGGVIDDETAPRLACRIVAGAANNQLADDRIADLLASHGVLWAPDFVVNAGGLINISEEIHGYDPAVARRRVRGIANTLRQVFDAADANGDTPLSAAIGLARGRLRAADRA
jgi:leucine dehydrogenase